MPYRQTNQAPRRQRTGILVRLLIAGAIALFSVISYFSMGDTNPITGQTQRVALSPDQEIALGSQAAPKMAQQHGGLHLDQQAQQRVDRIGAELLQAVGEIVRDNGGDNPFEFEFHLLADEQTVNALALPGGQVFNTAALYKRLESEGQLAGVIGHEIGHVLMRHGAQRMAKQKLTQGLVSGTGVAGGGEQSAQMAAAIGNMINMKYGRDDELESDKWGVELCVEAGYDPRSMLDVMRILEEASGGGGPTKNDKHSPQAGTSSAIHQGRYRIGLS